MAETVEAALARIDESIKGLKSELLTKLDGHQQVLSGEIAHAAKEAAQNLALVAQRVSALEADARDLKGGLSVLETHAENRLKQLEDFTSRAKGVLGFVSFLATAGFVSAVVEIVRALQH